VHREVAGGHQHAVLPPLLLVLCQNVQVQAAVAVALAL
jgi:hypothetical protein